MARRDGYDWGRIGRLLGVSRQAARQRWATTDLGNMLPSTRRAAYRDPVEAEDVELALAHHLEKEQRRLDDTDEAVPW